MNKKGFTIVETMLSVLLIMIGIIQITTIISYSLKFTKKTKDLFLIDQKAEYIKNQLLSEPFLTTNLKAEEIKKNEKEYKIIFKIINKSDSLKEINLSIRKNNIGNKYFFIKSKYIN